MSALVGFASIAFEHRIGALNFFLLFFKSRDQRFEMASSTTILLSYKMLLSIPLSRAAGWNLLHTAPSTPTASQ